MEAKRQSSRQILKAPGFCLFKFDVDGIQDVYATRTVEGTLTKGGKGKVIYKGKEHWGTIVDLGGKESVLYSLLLSYLLFRLRYIVIYK